MMRTMWLSGAWSKADVLRLNLAAELCDVQITWNEEVSNGGNAGMDAVMGGTATLRAQREGNNDEAVRGAAAALRLLVAVGGPRAAPLLVPWWRQKRRARDERGRRRPDAFCYDRYRAPIGQVAHHRAGPVD